MKLYSEPFCIMIYQSPCPVMSSHIQTCYRCVKADACGNQFLVYMYHTTTQHTNTINFLIHKQHSSSNNKQAVCFFCLGVVRFVACLFRHADIECQLYRSTKNVNRLIQSTSILINIPAQLKINKSTSLLSYLHKVDASHNYPLPLCSLCCTRHHKPFLLCTCARNS